MKSVFSSTSKYGYAAAAFALLAAAACGSAGAEDVEQSSSAISATTRPSMDLKASGESLTSPLPIPSITSIAYNGGSVIPNVKVVAVFWGDSVNSTVTNGVGGFYSSLLQNPWIDALSEYDTQVAGGSNQAIGRGSFAGAFEISPQNTATQLSDGAIQTELAAQIKAKVLPASDGNTLYMIDFPPGIQISDGSLQSCVNGGFCAYHNSFSANGATVMYGVVPDFGPGSGCQSGCGSDSSFFNNLTATSSHEVAEAITDPNGNAWISGKTEIGDACNHVQATLPGTGFTIQTQWSNRLGQCMPFDNGPTYQALDLSDVFVEGQDGKLWFEHGPFGSVPPARQQVDGAVLTFQALDASDVLVLGSNGVLWFEHAPFGNVPPTRQEVDATVRSFQALDASDILVQGDDGKLWFEHAPFGSVPPTRQEIDATVQSFHAIDSGHVLVLGTDGKLWMEDAPFGTVPPARQEVDQDVRQYAAIDTTHVLVLGTDNKLWLAQGPFGSVPPSRTEVDATVRTFQALDTSDIYVLGSDGKLWFEHAPFGGVPPSRQEVDATVATFRAIDSQHVLVLGTDGKLWLEVAPFGSVPPSRNEVDATVQF